LLTTTSAPITPEERIKAQKTLCRNFSDSYGANEMGMVARSTPTTIHQAPESVGQIVPDVEAQVVDANHHPLPAGEIGALRFRAADFPDRYIDNTEATARHFRDGWFYPGDIGAIDGDGLLFLKGRSDDAINNAGVTFYPIEIEQILQRHPDILEVAVLPWPHPFAGEVAVACVVVKKEKFGPDIKAYCAANLSGHLEPKYILKFKALPKNAMGKILKTELARNLAAMLAPVTAKEN
jgi:acyl-coenzyme A synthetase/AMP-(fatty) acid ligase